MTIKIILNYIGEPVLLIPAKSGVLYQNQTWGTQCFQDEIEGNLIPLDSEDKSTVHGIGFGDFVEKMFPKGSSGVITTDMGKEIEKFLGNSATMKGIQIDWEKFEESHEAWLHVIVNDSEFSAYSGIVDKKAILTWPNSD